MDIDHLMIGAAVLIAASTLAVGIAKRMNLGSTVALIVVGLALGPHSPKPLAAGHVDELDSVGQIGVALLLFVVGLGIQPRRLLAMSSLILGLGSAQLVLSTLAIAIPLVVLGAEHHWIAAVVAGLGLAMSSDAVSYSSLQARGDDSSGHARATAAVQIFQSIAAIPILAAIPMLPGGSDASTHPSDLRVAGNVFAVLAGVYLVGRFAMPAALRLTARRLGSGAFGLVIIAAVLGAAAMMDLVGVSMALGAMMMGIALSTSEFAEQIKAAIAPAKEVLMGLFFIAIGMAIDVGRLEALAGRLLVVTPTLMLVKFIVAFAVARCFRLDPKQAALTGLLLVPFDEIAYVIFASAHHKGMLSEEDYTLGLSMISLSFVLSPLLINLGYKLSDRWADGRPDQSYSITEEVLKERVVVVGYGYVGRAMCAMLARAGIDYVAFDDDLDRLAQAKSWRHNVRYGDLTEPTMMSTSLIDGARLVVLTARDFHATRRMLGNLRRFHPSVPVTTAVQFLVQREELRALGAVRVVALMPEGVLRFAHSVLDTLGVGAKTVDEVVEAHAADDYALLRGVKGAEPESAKRSKPLAAGYRPGGSGGDRESTA